jgi:hypothetical protein
MTLHCSKLALLPVLLTGCLIGAPARDVFAHTSGTRFDSPPESVSPKHSERAESLDQTPGVRQEETQQESRARKRRPLHDYGPDDVIPETAEHENPRPRKRPVGPLKAGNKTPITSVPVVTPGPPSTSIVTPTPAPRSTSTASTVPAAVKTSSLPRNVKRDSASWWISFVSASLVLLFALFTLFFVVAKLGRQLRAGKQPRADQASRGPSYVAEVRTIRADRRAGTGQRDKRYGRAPGA